MVVINLEMVYKVIQDKFLMDVSVQMFYHAKCLLHCLRCDNDGVKFVVMLVLNGADAASSTGPQRTTTVEAVDSCQDRLPSGSLVEDFSNLIWKLQF